MHKAHITNDDNKDAIYFIEQIVKDLSLNIAEALSNNPLSGGIELSEDRSMPSHNKWVQTSPEM